MGFKHFLVRSSVPDKVFGFHYWSDNLYHFLKKNLILYVALFFLRSNKGHKKQIWYVGHLTCKATTKTTQKHSFYENLPLKIHLA